MWIQIFANHSHLPFKLIPYENKISVELYFCSIVPGGRQIAFAATPHNCRARLYKILFENELQRFQFYIFILILITITMVSWIYLWWLIFMFLLFECSVSYFIVDFTLELCIFGRKLLLRWIKNIKRNIKSVDLIN